MYAVYKIEDAKAVRRIDRRCADLSNTVGLKDDDTYTCDLRSELEPAKHKILDIIGDLHLTGRNPLGFKAHIIAKLAGHKSHVEFAKLIMKEL